MTSKELKELQDIFPDSLKIMSKEAQTNLMMKAMSTKKGRKVLRSLLIKFSKQFDITKQQLNTTTKLINIIDDIDEMDSK